MTNVEENKSLISQVEEVLFNYCPYTEDRLELLNNISRSEFDIHFSFGKNFTQVDFVYGNYRSKSSVPEELSVNRVVELKEIEKLIDFIKDDHDAMYYDKHDRNMKSAGFKFDIRWGGEGSIKGIKCGTIGIILHFRDNPELEKKYLYFLDKKYFNSSDVSSVKSYTDEVIKSYIDSLDKDGLMSLLNRMSEKDLKELLTYSNKQIAEYVKSEPKVKQYFIEK